MSKVPGSWKGTVARLGAALLTLSAVVAGASLALGRGRPREGIITFPVYMRSGSTTIYGVDAGSGFAAPLLYRRRSADCALWSPDGSKAAIRVYEEGGAMIHLVSVNGDDLDTPPFAADALEWSPDSRQLAIQATQQDGQIDVLLLDLASGDMRNLSESLSTGAHQPVWSPDGRQVAFLSPDSIYNHVYIAEAQSGEARHLAQLDAASTDQLAWSADGRQMILSLTYDTGGAFFILDVGSGRLRRMTSEQLFFSPTKRSPGGDLLAFVGVWEPEGYGLYVMDAGTASLRRVFPTDAAAALGDFAWSPEGDTLAFVAYTQGSASFDETLYLVNRDGSGLRALTDTVSGGAYLAWSPDGRQIAFRSDDAADPDGELPGLALDELYVIGVDGSNLRRLTYSIGPTMPWCYGWGG